MYSLDSSHDVHVCNLRSSVRILDLLQILIPSLIYLPLSDRCNMKFLIVSSLLGLTSSYISLEEAYGVVNETATLIPWNLRANKKDCDSPLEIVIVQDVSDSFQPHIDNMRDVQIAQMTQVLGQSHPGTKFSVLSFRDKPIWPHGSKGDFCQRFESPLSANATHVSEVYSRLVSAGGADPAENQFGAIVAAAQSSSPEWSQSRATRLIVLATDACPHFADDGLNQNGLKAFSGRFDDKRSEEQCSEEYYPSPAQVKAALRERQAFLAQLIFDGDETNGSVRSCWEWFNDYLGQESAFLEPLAKDGSNFWTVLMNVIKNIEGEGCQPTSTVAPTTKETTTNTVGLQFEAGKAYKINN